MTNPGPNDVLVPVADLVGELIDGEYLVYHPRHTRAIYLNPSAALIFGLCDGVRSVESIHDLIKEGYPDAPENLLKELVTTLGRLEDYGILIRA